MAALTNRVNRILSRSADDRTAAAVESIAEEEIAAALADKITPGTEPTPETGPDGEIYDGDRDIGVHNPTFDATPPEYVTAFLTERGTLEPAGVADVAADHAALAAWRDNDGNG